MHVARVGCAMPRPDRNGRRPRWCRGRTNANGACWDPERGDWPAELPRPTDQHADRLRRRAAGPDVTAGTPGHGPRDPLREVTLWVPLPEPPAASVVSRDTRNARPITVAGRRRACNIQSGSVSTAMTMSAQASVTTAGSCLAV